MNGLTREEVYKIIDGERAYQDDKWPNHQHTAGEYLNFLRHYLNEAVENITTAYYDESVLESIRKIAGLAVACMEENGCPPRKMRKELAEEALQGFIGENMTTQALYKMNLTIAKFRCKVDRDPEDRTKVVITELE